MLYSNENPQDKNTHRNAVSWAEARNSDSSGFALFFLFQSVCLSVRRLHVILPFFTQEPNLEDYIL